LSAANIAIITLSSVGSVAEGAGIVMVAGRVTDLKTYLRGQVNATRQRYAIRKRALKEFFPTPPPLHLQGLEKDAVVEPVPPGGARAGGISPGVLIEEDRALEEGVTAVEARQSRIEGQVARLERALPTRIREETKDPWRGLALLFGGLACLLTASILGAVAS
jgi:hypothetical protein